MSRKEYRWKPGPKMPVSAEDAQAELDKLRRQARARGKELAARDVVNAARDSDHPLHACFCWDDQKAGERYRVVEAGRLIRRIEIVVIHRKVESRPVTINISTVHHKRGRGYMDAREVVADSDAYATVLEEVKLQLLAVQRRYAHIKELPSLVREVFFDGPGGAAA